MTVAIKSVNVNQEIVLNNRTIYTSDWIRSININQITGDFIVTKPLLDGGTILVYPQTPNHPELSLIGETKTIRSFSGYGNINYPLDAKYDYTRGKIWVADSGNNRVIKANENNFFGEFSIPNIDTPHSVVPNLNNGGVFIKAFSNSTTGVVYNYSSSGTLISSFTYYDLNGEDLPLPYTMVFDHRRSRLWWTAQQYIYMMDAYNSQVISYDINTDGCHQTRGIDVDLDSGYAFVVAYGKKNSWFIIQMFRDNNRSVSMSYVPERVLRSCINV